MNYSTAVFLINPNLRAIKVSYQPKPNERDEFFGFEENGHEKKHVKIFKSLDPNIKKDDLVVIPTQTRYGLTVGKVTEVDVPVDYDSAEEVKWVVSRVDKTTYDQIVTDEAQYIQEMRMAEERAKREELKAKLLKANVDKLLLLPIASTTIAKVGG